MSEQLHSIKEVLEDLKAGKPVIIVDDESRENEGDLIIAAEFATQENINFMVKYARGIVCTPMRREALEKLGIPAMVTKNTDNHENCFHRYCRPCRYYNRRFSSRACLYNSKTIRS